MNAKSKKRCSCGSGRKFEQCCGKSSSNKKLELERTAKRFSAAGMHVEAADALAVRASLSPENPMIWNDLGVEHVAAGQLPEALTAFTRAYEVLPDYPITLYNLGKFWLDQSVQHHAEQDDQPQAIAQRAAVYLQASVDQDSSLVSAHELLHRVFEILGDHQKASSHLAQALRLNPELKILYDRPYLERLPLVGRLFVKTAYRGPSFISSR